MERSQGFPPVASADARSLILGSLPGARSIAEQQYYAHPQNAFWRIMGELFGITGDYETRCAQLNANGIALWDVLHSSIRPGSMDADIKSDTAAVNDFADFFSAHPNIRTVAFNGKKATFHALRCARCKNRGHPACCAAIDKPCLRVHAVLR